MRRVDYLSCCLLMKMKAVLDELRHRNLKEPKLRQRIQKMTYWLISEEVQKKAPRSTRQNSGFGSGSDPISPYCF